MLGTISGPLYEAAGIHACLTVSADHVSVGWFAISKVSGVCPCKRPACVRSAPPAFLPDHPHLDFPVDVAPFFGGSQFSKQFGKRAGMC